MRKFFPYNQVCVLSVLFFLSLTIKSYAQPVRSLPPAKNTTTKPITKPKTVVIEKNKDSDGDGLIDNVDKCPDAYGAPSNDGCPLEKKKDRDNDGVPDETDVCPDAAGSSANDGCPPKATLTIEADVYVKITVDGAFIASIAGNSPYPIRLTKGIHDIKVESLRYDVFEQKKDFKVEDINQQNSWKVRLKDDEDARAKIELGQKMTQKAQKLVGLINDCMVKNFKEELTEKKYYLTLNNGRLQYSCHTDLTSTRKTNYRDNYLSTDVTTITGFDAARIDNKYGYYASNYLVSLFCDVAERDVDFDHVEKISKRALIHIMVRDDCALDLQQKLKKLLED